jgi:hypothetical protein
MCMLCHLPTLMPVRVDGKRHFHLVSVSAHPLVRDANIAVILCDVVLVNDDFSTGIIVNSFSHQDGVFALRTDAPVTVRKRVSNWQRRRQKGQGQHSKFPKRAAMDLFI